MGWKSTIDITREEAIQAILNAINKSEFDSYSNQELEDKMEQLEIGDTVGSGYFGYNFTVVDTSRGYQ